MELATRKHKSGQNNSRVTALEGTEGFQESRAREE